MACFWLYWRGDLVKVCPDYIRTWQSLRVKVRTSLVNSLVPRWMICFDQTMEWICRGVRKLARTPLTAQENKKTRQDLFLFPWSHLVNNVLTIIWSSISSFYIFIRCDAVREIPPETLETPAFALSLNTTGKNKVKKKKKRNKEETELKIKTTCILFKHSSLQKWITRKPKSQIW